MTKIKLDNWLDIVGNLAVVIGLIVVALELRQNSMVANGELTSQFMSNWQQIDGSRQDPDFALVYAKSIEQPEALTLSERVQLDGYYWSVMDQLELARLLVEKELFFGEYEQIVRTNVRIFFTTPYARAWWQSFKSHSDPITTSIIDDEIANTAAGTADNLFNTIASGQTK